MSIKITPFLRNALFLDAVATGATALLLIVGAGPLASFLELPAPLLLWAGMLLVPFVALVGLSARRPEVSRVVLIDIIAVNVLWVAASIGILVTDSVQPNLLGTLFIAAQALVVALFAELQFVGMRRATAA